MHEDILAKPSDAILENISESYQYKSQSLLKRAYPWIVWVLSAAFIFYKYVLQVSPGVMSSELMSTFSVGGAGLGNLAACFFYSYLLMQIPVGILLDKYSPRIIITISVFVCALGTMLFANASSLLIAELSRALIGLGAAFAIVSSLKLATIWFPPKRFAFIAGLSITAAMFGAMGGQAPLSSLVSHVGWREAMTYTGIFGFLVAFLVVLIVKDKSSQNSLAVQSLSSSPKMRVSEQLRTIFKSQQTWLLSIYSALVCAPISVFGGLWGVSFLKEAYHLTSTSAAASVSIIFIGFAIGCPIAGWLSDYVGRRKTVMAIGTGIACLATSAVLYIPVQSMLLLQILLFTFGISASCCFICFSMAREIHPLMYAATVLGFLNTFEPTLTALSEPLVGKLLDLGWNGVLENGARTFSVHNYQVALTLLPLFFGAAFCLLFFIKETYCKQVSS